MSTWHEVDEGDIDIDSERNEVNFFVCDDRWGSVYLVLSFEQIKEIASKINKEEPKP